MTLQFLNSIFLLYDINILFITIIWYIIAQWNWSNILKILWDCYWYKKKFLKLINTYTRSHIIREKKVLSLIKIFLNNFQINFFIILNILEIIFVSRCILISILVNISNNMIIIRLIFVIVWREWILINKIML